MGLGKFIRGNRQKAGASLQMESGRGAGFDAVSFWQKFV